MGDELHKSKVTGGTVVNADSAASAGARLIRRRQHAAHATCRP